MNDPFMNWNDEMREAEAVRLARQIIVISKKLVCALDNQSNPEVVESDLVDVIKEDLKKALLKLENMQIAEVNRMRAGKW